MLIEDPQVSTATLVALGDKATVTHEGATPDVQKNHDDDLILKVQHKE